MCVFSAPSNWSQNGGKCLNNPKAKGMVHPMYAQDTNRNAVEPQAAVQHPHTVSQDFIRGRTGIQTRPDLRGNRIFRRYFHFAPQEGIQEQYQMGPAATRRYLQRRVAEQLAWCNREALEDAWEPGRGVPWFTAKQQRHAEEQCMACVSTMQDLSRQ